MILPFGDTDMSESQIYVKFSNLIHNAKIGSAKSYRDMSYTLLKKVGLLCTVENLDYKPDLDMGFFEHKGLIFAKAFTIDLDLIMNDPASAGLPGNDFESGRVLRTTSKTGFKYY